MLVNMHYALYSNVFRSGISILANFWQTVPYCENEFN